MGLTYYISTLACQYCEVYNREDCASHFPVQAWKPFIKWCELINKDYHVLEVIIVKFMQMMLLRHIPSISYQWVCWGNINHLFLSV